jgi:hypothetical protein
MDDIMLGYKYVYEQVQIYIITCSVVRVAKITGSTSDDWMY